MQFILKVKDVGNGHVAVECTPTAREIIGTIASKVRNNEEPTGAEHFISKILSAVKEMNDSLKRQMAGLPDEDIVDVDRALHLPGRDF